MLVLKRKSEVNSTEYVTFCNDYVEAKNAQYCSNMLLSNWKTHSVICLFNVTTSWPTRNSISIKEPYFFMDDLILKDHRKFNNNNIEILLTAPNSLFRNLYEFTSINGSFSFQLYYNKIQSTLTQRNISYYLNTRTLSRLRLPHV